MNTRRFSGLSEAATETRHSQWRNAVRYLKNRPVLIEVRGNLRNRIIQIEITDVSLLQRGRNQEIVLRGGIYGPGGSIGTQTYTFVLDDVVAQALHPPEARLREMLQSVELGEVLGVRDLPDAPCPTCGRVSAKENFCRQCGTRVRWAEDRSKVEAGEGVHRCGYKNESLPDEWLAHCGGCGARMVSRMNHRQSPTTPWGGSELSEGC